MPPSLIPEKADKRVSMGRVLYLMIKTYAVGLLTPSISSLKPGYCLSFFSFIAAKNAVLGTDS